MNLRQIILCFTASLFCHQLAADAFQKSRIKSLSKINDNYHYTVIRNNREFKKKRASIGLDLRDQRGYVKWRNYLVIKNVRNSLNRSIKGYHPKDQLARSNLGILTNKCRSADLINVVQMNNTRLNANNFVNAGVKSKCKSMPLIKINNNTTLNNSHIGENQ